MPLERAKHKRNRISSFPPEYEEIERMFEGALELLDIFESTARRKMLLSMYKEPCDKSYLRRLVNPKLVYENLAMLQEQMLIEELSDGKYDLTEMGKRILRQYLQFLEDLRKTMWED